MNRFFIITLLVIYILSCSSRSQNETAARAIRASLSFETLNSKSRLDKIKSFNDFLTEMTRDQMIASGDEDLQQLARFYFPDSTVIPGLDLHAREIGTLDSFRLVFYEYFDLYATDQRTTLGAFSPTGTAMDALSVHKVSFEGNVSINILDEQLVEVIYYDFFDQRKVEGGRTIMPTESFYMRPFKKKEDFLEGYIYEYYRLSKQGRFKRLPSNGSLSFDRAFPQASARVLSYSELELLSFDQISLIKHEILADHGYIFKAGEVYRFFMEKPWYNPRYNDVEAFLSPIEKINIKKLEKLEQEY